MGRDKSHVESVYNNLGKSDELETNLQDPTHNKFTSFEMTSVLITLTAKLRQDDL